jgi:D-glycero-D-manno-heptose 1,7-bisphosphate phosphatase
MNKAVFIDKDGTLIEDIPYNVDPALIRYSEHAIKALKAFQENGYLIIMVSNQSGIAKGYFSELDLSVVINKIRTDLAEQGIEITAVYYCPHYPDTAFVDYAKNCDCRKPAPGMLLQAAKEFNIDLGKSWMIGDILDDMEAGKRAGCKTILLDVGNETEWKFDKFRKPDFFAGDMDKAAWIILSMQL